MAMSSRSPWPRRIATGWRHLPVAVSGARNISSSRYRAWIPRSPVTRGGTVPNPTYELVNTETTGHAETVLVYYDNKKITYEELTNVFFLSHDPTTPNRQGPDVGSSYRSILFYSNDQEKKIAEKALEKFKTSFSNPIVTEIKPLTKFYRAEGYHQDYIEHNPREPYVVKVSIPRFEKFKEAYKGKLRHGY